jgi:hypothetical protein
MQAEKHRGQSVRVPTKGGEVFISVSDLNGGDMTKGASVIQADLNAAANIGLRALTDPDWPGRWWYVPCNTSDGKPNKDRVGGCPIIAMDRPLAAESTETDVSADADAPKKPRRGKRGPSKATGPKKEIVNYWRDPSSDAVLPDGGWKATKDYWRDVECRVVERLRRFASPERALDMEMPWG